MELAGVSAESLPDRTLQEAADELAASSGVLTQATARWRSLPAGGGGENGIVELIASVGVPSHCSTTFSRRPERRRRLGSTCRGCSILDRGLALAVGGEARADGDASAGEEHSSSLSGRVMALTSSRLRNFSASSSASVGAFRERRTGLRPP